MTDSCKKQTVISVTHLNHEITWQVDIVLARVILNGSDERNEALSFANVTSCVVCVDIPNP